MNYKKSFLISLVLFLAFLFAGLGSKQSSQTQNQAPTSTLLTADPATFDDEFNQIKIFADEKSTAWRKDAKLVYVSTKIALNLDPALTQHTFVYNSINDPNNHWAIAIEAGNKSLLRALIPKEDYLGSNLAQILPLYWKVNFVKALQICEGGGGKDFREQNPSNYKIELDLARDQTNNLRWTCKYSTLDDTNTKEIKVDAGNGEII